MDPRLCTAVAGEPLPLLLADLEAVERNADTLGAAAGDKKLRVATKSLRCLGLLEAVTKRLGARFGGVMAYAAGEAAVLVDAGYTDVVVAYPTVQKHELELLARLNERARVALVVDDARHVEAAARAGSLPLLIEVNTSLEIAGAYLGVRRSPLRAADDVVALARRIAETPRLRFLGLMLYEAHVAGVPDATPFARWQNPLKRLVRRFGQKRVAEQRRALVAALAAAGLAPEVVNGGGTATVGKTASEAAVNEVTAGSGFLCPQLFDWYSDVSLEAAAFFALSVVRRAARDIVTCSGGGYVASGVMGPDRLPVPVWPAGLKLLGIEGAGEVQTPVRGPAAERLHIGDAVFFRPAKAGEIAERFNDYVLVRGERVVGRAPTYRGAGHSYF